MISFPSTRATLFIISRPGLHAGSASFHALVHRQNSLLLSMQLLAHMLADRSHAGVGDGVACCQVAVSAISSLVGSPGPEAVGQPPGEGCKHEPQLQRLERAKEQCLSGIQRADKRVNNKHLITSTIISNASHLIARRNRMPYSTTLSKLLPPGGQAHTGAAFHCPAGSGDVEQGPRGGDTRTWRSNHIVCADDCQWHRTSRGSEQPEEDRRACRGLRGCSLQRAHANSLWHCLACHPVGGHISTMHSRAPPLLAGGLTSTNSRRAVDTWINPYQSMDGALGLHATGNGLGWVPTAAAGLAGRHWSASELAKAWLVRAAGGGGRLTLWPAGCGALQVTTADVGCLVRLK